MGEIQQILELLGKHGWQPVLAAALLLLVLRVGKPEIIAPAVARVYADVCRAVGVWWESHRELVASEKDRAAAQAARERALEAALASAHPGGSRQVDRLVYGGGQDGGGGSERGRAAVPPVAPPEAPVGSDAGDDVPGPVGDPVGTGRDPV